MTWWSFALWGFLVIPGCGESPSAGPLRIAAASDMEAALPEVIAAFHKEQGDEAIEVETIFGSSVKLSQQITQGAPFDLFLCANQKIVSELAKAGVVEPATVKPYTKGTLVLIVGKTIPVPVESLEDLRNPAIKKIAIANPELAPYGMAAKQALQSAKLWDELRPKVVQSENVRQAVQFASTGNADAALVGRAVARVPEVRIFKIDPRLYKPLIQALGVVDGSSRKVDAEAFSRFILGPEGQRVLAKFGFSPAGT